MPAKKRSQQALVSSPKRQKKSPRPSEATLYHWANSNVEHSCQATFGILKLNSRYIGKYLSDSGGHTEYYMVETLKNFVNRDQTLLLEVGQLNKVSIHLNRSPCTSESREGYLKTSDRQTGCTELLIDLATNGFKNHRFEIRIKVARIYAPSIQGSIAASKLALRALDANGINIIGWDRSKSYANSEFLSTLGQPHEFENVSKEVVERNRMFWRRNAEEVSMAVGKAPNVTSWSADKEISDSDIEELIV